MVIMCRKKRRFSNPDKNPRLNNNNAKDKNMATTQRGITLFVSPNNKAYLFQTTLNLKKESIRLGITFSSTMKIIVWEKEVLEKCIKVEI